MFDTVDRALLEVMNSSFRPRLDEVAYALLTRVWHEVVPVPPIRITTVVGAVAGQILEDASALNHS